MRAPRLLIACLAAKVADVKSAPGTKHTSTVTRDAKGILVKIAPS